MTDDLSTWLLEQIAEDERVARDADPTLDGIADGWFTADGDIRFIQRFTSARMLAECEAKRRIVGLHKPNQLGGIPDADWGCECCDTGFASCGCVDWQDWPCESLKLVGLPYADRPGYRQEWKP